MIIVNTVWKYDIDKDLWSLFQPDNKFRGVIAEVRGDGSWQTFDTDGAGGESGQEKTIEWAKEVAEESAYDMGYL